MDWQPVIAAVVADHAERCPTAGDGHDWNFCDVTVPLPEMARRTGALTTVVTLADRQAAATPLPDKPELRVRCLCGCVRQNHSPIGDRCYGCPMCMIDGGFRPTEETA